MIIDKNLEFADSQAIIATAVSANVVPLREGIGAGNNLDVVVTVEESFNTLTSLLIELQTDVLDTMGSPVVIASRSVLLADLLVGNIFVLNVPIGTEGFGRLNFTVVGTDPTTGIVSASIQPGGEYASSIPND